MNINEAKTNDLIRRSDAIGLLEDMLLFGEYDIIASSFSKADEEKAYRAINDIPAVNRWIPCSERLPEQGERVIVAIFGSDMIMPNEGETLQDAIERSRKEGYITVGFIGSDGWYGADWFPLMVQPSYWMPKPDLPEPPKE